MNPKTHKIAPAFLRNRMSHFAESHLPFAEIAYAISGLRRFSPIPQWLRPIPVWMMNDER